MHATFLILIGWVALIHWRDGESLERVISGEPDGYQELSINIDTGGLAARRLMAKLVAGR